MSLEKYVHVRQLIANIQDLASSTDTIGQTNIILLNFSNACDKVPHEKLLSKMEHVYGGIHTYGSATISL